MSVHFWIIWGSWMLFLLFWLAMGFSAKKNIHSQPAAERRRYTIPLVAGLLLMMIRGQVFPFLAPLAAPLYERTPPILVTADVMAVLGVAIAIWARVTLGRNWSGVVTFKESHELVTSGPYALVRHPIYTALILLFLAMDIPLATPAAAAGFLLVVWSCWVKLQQEEALMLQQFPDSYPAYMARTRRLVPGLV